MGEVKHNNHAFDDLAAEMRRDHPSEMALAGEWAAGWADGVNHGAAQIDAMRAENAELVAALEGLLCASGSHSCSTLHHSKADQHKHDEPCKPRIRYELSLDNARAALAKHRGE